MIEVLVVEFRIRDENIEAFAEAIALNARSSMRDEPGCLRFDVCRDPLDPALFFLYELYEDAEAIQAHLSAPHYLAMNRQIETWVASKTVRRLKLKGES